MNQPPNSKIKDVEHLAGLLSAVLTIFVMANAIDGYYETMLAYFKALIPVELAHIATLATYGLGGGIAYKFFKIVLTALLMSSIFSVLRGATPLAPLGFS